MTSVSHTTAIANTARLIDSREKGENQSDATLWNVRKIQIQPQSIIPQKKRKKKKKRRKKRRKRKEEEKNEQAKHQKKYSSLTKLN